MSIQCVAVVLDFAPPHWCAGQRLVALALADRVNQDWECWPSIADLSRRSGLGERAVQKYLRALERDSVIGRAGQRKIAGKPASNLWIWQWRPWGQSP